VFEGVDFGENELIGHCVLVQQVHGRLGGEREVGRKGGREGGREGGKIRVCMREREGRKEGRGEDKVTSSCFITPCRASMRSKVLLNTSKPRELR